MNMDGVTDAPSAGDHSDAVAELDQALRPT
jgi:hypothetical protein